MSAETDKATDFAVFLRRRLEAPRETVFRAWTEPEILKKWFGPEGFRLAHAEIDLRVGGTYRFAMQQDEGATLHHSGTYREIVPPEKLVFSWISEHEPEIWSGLESGETLVTVRFVELDGATEISLYHEHLADERAREGLTFGWGGGLERLGKLLSAT